MAEETWGSLKKRADDATKPPEAGWYLLEVTKAEVGAAQSSGKPMIKCVFRVVGGTADGKTVFNNFNLTLDNEFALGIFFRHMAAFGFGDDYFARLPAGDAGLTQLAAALVGRRCRAELSQREWPAGSGTMRSQVDSVMPPTGGAGGPAAPAGPPGGPPIPTAGPVPAPAPTPTSSPAPPIPAF